MATLFTERELAERWKLTARTLRSWRKDGKGPAFLDIGNNTIRYRAEDIAAYEEKNLQGGEQKESSEEHS